VVLAVIIILFIFKARGSKDITLIKSENTVLTITDTENKESSEKTDPENTEIVPSLEKLMTKSNEAINHLKSYIMNGSSVKDMYYYKYGEKIQKKQSLFIREEYVNEPTKLHTTINIKSDKKTREIEQYLTKDGLYTLDDGIFTVDNEERWVHENDDTIQETLKDQKDNNNLSMQLKRYSTIKDKTKITIEDDHYVLTASIDGDKLDTLGRDLLSSNLTDEDVEIKEVLDQMKFTTIKMKTKINKDTLLQVSTDTEISLEYNLNGNKLFVNWYLNFKFDNFNKIYRITIPSKVLNSVKAH
jgi:hypothetical protein